jgi:hypothetical protein
VLHHILINKKVTDDYKLYQLDDNFNINEIEKRELIPDANIICGINKKIYGIHLIQANLYSNKDLFRRFINRVQNTGYQFFNRLKDIMYVKKPAGVLYQQNINIVLSLIFIGNFDIVFKILSDLNDQRLTNITNYHNYSRTGSLISDLNDVKTNVLIDYIHRDDLMIDHLKNIDNMPALISLLNNKFSHTEKINFADKMEDFNLICKIINFVYDYVMSDTTIIQRYNYSLYINKLITLNTAANDTNFKSLISFINTYNENVIRNKLVLNLTYLIYLCYKTNLESGLRFNLSQYMMIDYLNGITQIQKPCYPINKRSVLVKLLNIVDTPELSKEKPIDRFEMDYYGIQNNFKVLKQFTFDQSSSPLVGGRKYSDCGETTIINMFNYLLLNEDGRFNLSDSASWDDKLIAFYRKYPSMDLMYGTDLATVKADLAGVISDRELITYNRESKYDLNTKYENMILTCNILLGIHPDPIKDFKTIFRKLNNRVNIGDITVTVDGSVYVTHILEYKSNFRATFHTGHADFVQIVNTPDKIRVSDISHILDNHWINIEDANNRMVNPTVYSLEHFIYLYKRNNTLFPSISPYKQTEEICIVAVKPYYRLDSLLPWHHSSQSEYNLFTPEEMADIIEKYNTYMRDNEALLREQPRAQRDPDEDEDYYGRADGDSDDREPWIRDRKELYNNMIRDIRYNFTQILNKTYNICVAAISSSWKLIYAIARTEFIDKPLYDLAFNRDPPYSYNAIDIIPPDMQDEQMVTKILSLSPKYRSKLMRFINPELLRSMQHSDPSLYISYDDHDYRIAPADEAILSQLRGSVPTKSTIQTQPVARSRYVPPHKRGSPPDRHAIPHNYDIPLRHRGALADPRRL